MSKAEDNIAVIRRAAEAVSSGDLAVIGQLTLADFVRHDLAEAFPPVEGTQGVTDFLQMVRAALPDLRIEIEDIFASEDRVAMHIRISGTHQGEILGVPPTGKRVEYRSVNLYRMADGKIAETWQLADVWGFMRQVGAIPA